MSFFWTKPIPATFEITETKVYERGFIIRKISGWDLIRATFSHRVQYNSKSNDKAQPKITDSMRATTWLRVVNFCDFAFFYVFNEAERNKTESQGYSSKCAMSPLPHQILSISESHFKSHTNKRAGKNSKKMNNKFRLSAWSILIKIADNNNYIANCSVV